MNRGKSFILILLVSVFLLSSLCGCGERNLLEDGLGIVKMDKEIAALVKDFFQAIEQEDVDKLVTYLYMPEEYASSENLNLHYYSETEIFIRRISRSYGTKPDKIEYTDYSTKVNDKTGTTFSYVSFIWFYEDLELEGEITVIDDTVSSGIWNYTMGGLNALNISQVLGSYLIDYN